MARKINSTISARIIYYVPGPYGPIQRQEDNMRHYSIEELRDTIRNVDSVLKRDGAKHIVLDRDHMLAVQVSGYSWHRGAFCDVVPLAELAPFLG